MDEHAQPSEHGRADRPLVSVAALAAFAFGLAPVLAWPAMWLFTVSGVGQGGLRLLLVSGAAALVGGVIASLAARHLVRVWALWRRDGSSVRKLFKGRASGQRKPLAGGVKAVDVAGFPTGLGSVLAVGRDGYVNDPGVDFI